MDKIIKVFAQTIDLKTQYGFGGITSLAEAFGYLVRPAFGIAGTAVLIYFLWAASKMVFSAGNKDSVASAQKMITHAIIGFVLLMLTFVVFQFLPQFFGISFRVIELPVR